jgi:hypothetical protein
MSHITNDIDLDDIFNDIDNDNDDDLNIDIKSNEYDYEYSDHISKIIYREEDIEALRSEFNSDDIDSAIDIVNLYHHNFLVNFYSVLNDILKELGKPPISISYNHEVILEVLECLTSNDVNLNIYIGVGYKKRLASNHGTNDLGEIINIHLKYEKVNFLRYHYVYKLTLLNIFLLLVKRDDYNNEIYFQHVNNQMKFNQEWHRVQLFQQYNHVYNNNDRRFLGWTVLLNSSSPYCEDVITTAFYNYNRKEKPEKYLARKKLNFRGFLQRGIYGISYVGQKVRRITKILIGFNCSFKVEHYKSDNILQDALNEFGIDATSMEHTTKLKGLLENGGKLFHRLAYLRKKVTPIDFNLLDITKVGPLSSLLVCLTFDPVNNRLGHDALRVECTEAGVPLVDDSIKQRLHFPDKDVESLNLISIIGLLKGNRHCLDVSNCNKGIYIEYSTANFPKMQWLMCNSLNTVNTQCSLPFISSAIRNDIMAYHRKFWDVFFTKPNQLTIDRYGKVELSINCYDNFKLESQKSQFKRIIEKYNIVPLVTSRENSTITGLQAILPIYKTMATEYLHKQTGDPNECFHRVKQLLANDELEGESIRLFRVILNLSVTSHKPANIQNGINKRKRIVELNKNEGEIIDEIHACRTTQELKLIEERVEQIPEDEKKRILQEIANQHEFMEEFLKL